MDELTTITCERDDGVAVVTLDREEVHNAFNETMQRELRGLWRAFREDDDIRAVVLTGRGTKAFCTGIDRSEIPTTEEDYYFDALTYEDPGRNIGPRSQGLWKPIIAAVNGMACAGAFYLLGECDILVAAEHATFFDPHVTYSMPAVFEPSLLLSKMPFGEVMRMTLTGAAERISAARALEVGFVTEVVPSEELLSAAVELATTIAAQPPAAVQASLRTLWAARDLSTQQVQELGNLFLNISTTKDALAEGQSGFASKARTKPKIR